jgi:hypothetical protein
MIINRVWARKLAVIQIRDRDLIDVGGARFVFFENLTLMEQLRMAKSRILCRFSFALAALGAPYIGLELTTGIMSETAIRSSERRGSSNTWIGLFGFGYRVLICSNSQRIS